MLFELAEEETGARNKRSLQPSQGNPWEVNPSVSKGNDGNTVGRVEVKRTGENTDVNAGYGKVFRGPNRGRETWHVGATHRWRRSLQSTQNKNPWEVNPSVSKGNDGNTEGRVEVKRTGENTDVNAGYGKVFRGPNRGRETWHVGATHRWRRSVQPTQNKNPWEVNPSVSKGNDGNTEGRVEVKRTGENTDVNAGYGKVFRGPNRGRETWHVGATHRWRRSIQPTQNKNPWEVNPSVSKGNDGNTVGRVEVKRTGENTDVNAGYGKVFRGPNRGRETWHVGATHRWRRSLQPTQNKNPWEVNPSVSKGNDGNTEGRVEVKRTGENTDVNAGYGKVFRGPNRGRETWHVGATHRWRRSVQPTQNKNPWEVNPSVSKGNDGNTEGRVEVKRTGKNTDVDAGYGRVLRGPNRGRETWHVGATHRWRRDAPPVVPEYFDPN
ncbi:unnamed protein product [Acanthoscelides obtectus]|nr:unnamed protein product [Acanthoscelides obtectus]CAK1643325.1 hypothetical protein AOBTE_LOCUS13498 [Acanthoscelides obtectus]